MIGIALLIVGGSMLAFGLYETINSRQARKAVVDAVGGDGHLPPDGRSGTDSRKGWPVNDGPQGRAGQDVLTGTDSDDLFVARKTVLRELTLGDLQRRPQAHGNSNAAPRPRTVGIELVEQDRTVTMHEDIRDPGPASNCTETGLGQAGAGGRRQVDRNGVERVQITDFKIASDTLLYVYDGDEPEPELAFVDNLDGTQTLFANGEQVALIKADGPIATDDVVLFERGAIANLGL